MDLVYSYPKSTVRKETPDDSAGLNEFNKKFLSSNFVKTDADKVLLLGHVLKT